MLSYYAATVEDDEDDDGGRSMVSYDDDFDVDGSPLVVKRSAAADGVAGVAGGGGGGDDDDDDGIAATNVRSAAAGGVAGGGVVNDDVDDDNTATVKIPSNDNDNDNDKVTPNNQHTTPLAPLSNPGVDLFVEIPSPTTAITTTITPLSSRAPSIVYLHLSPLPTLLPWESEKTITLDSEKTSEKPYITKSPPRSTRNSQKSSQKFSQLSSKTGSASPFSINSPLTTAKSGGTLSVAWDDLLESDDER